MPVHCKGCAACRDAWRGQLSALGVSPRLPVGWFPPTPFPGWHKVVVSLLPCYAPCRSGAQWDLWCCIFCLWVPKQFGHTSNAFHHFSKIALCFPCRSKFLRTWGIGDREWRSILQHSELPSLFHVIVIVFVCVWLSCSLPRGRITFRWLFATLEFGS